jgi:hypothetical protein
VFQLATFALRTDAPLNMLVQVAGLAPGNGMDARSDAAVTARPDISVVIVTSPVRSHPSAEMLDRLLYSLSYLQGTFPRNVSSGWHHRPMQELTFPRSSWSATGTRRWRQGLPAARGGASERSRRP